MEVKATHRNARMSPRKVKPVGMVVRGLSVKDADTQLSFTPGKAAVIVRKVLNSAVANAVNNFDMNREELKVINVVANAGLTFKRFNPVSKGMAHPILKRNAHVTVVVSGAEGKEKKKSTPSKTDIKTLSAGQFVEEAMESTSSDVKDIKKEDSTVATKAKDERAQDTKADKAAGEAFQKKKMLQKGGDSKKTHRRESK